jgi:hypothetical protein
MPRDLSLGFLAIIVVSVLLNLTPSPTFNERHGSWCILDQDKQTISEQLGTTNRIQPSR